MMNLMSSLLADNVTMNFEYVASVVITGITVVFIGLILLVIILSLFGLISKLRTSANKKAESKKADKTDDTLSVKVQTASTAPVVEDGIEEEIVAVISAAIAEISAKSGKKLALKSIKAAKPQRTAWAAAGLIDNTRPF